MRLDRATEHRWSRHQRADKAVLSRIYGVLSCGRVSFRYQYTNDGELELGPMSRPLQITKKTLEPGQTVLASPGDHTFFVAKGRPATLSH